MLHHQTRHTLTGATLNRLQMATISFFSEKGRRLLPALGIPK